MAFQIRPVHPDDLPILGQRLAGPLFDRPPRAWGWIATRAGRPTGYALTARLFATWQATDVMDVQRVHLVDPDDRPTAAALLTAIRGHAAERGLTGVRWFEPENSCLTATGPDNLDQREKLRFRIGAARLSQAAPVVSGPAGAAPEGIRLATEADLPELVRLCAAHARYERADPPPVDLAGRLGRWLFEVPGRLWCLVVDAADGPPGVLAGYASCVREFDAAWAVDFLHLDCLYLDPSHRGAGVGSVLMARAGGLARRHGCATVRWQTPDWNVKAIRFYSRQGAVGISATQVIAPARPADPTQWRSATY